MTPQEEVLLQIAKIEAKLEAGDIKVAVIDNKAAAAHSRVDRMEDIMRADLKVLMTKMEGVVAFQERSKGWAAAALLIASILGAAIIKAATHFLS